jgi:hypothetical protein
MFNNFKSLAVLTLTAFVCAGIFAGAADAKSQKKTAKKKKYMTEEEVVDIVKRALAEKELQDRMAKEAETVQKDEEVAELVAKVVADKEKEMNDKAKKDKENDISIGGYMQVMYSDMEGQAAGTGANWNVSRARLIMKKKLNDKTSFFSQYNANTTNQDSSQFAIIDMYVDHKLTSDLGLQLGQFIIPTGYQPSLVSPKDTYMINLGQIYHNAAHDMNALWDTRDLGLRMQYKQKGSKFDYSLAVANGTGILSGIQRSDAKTVFGRIGYEPNKYWKLGIYGLSGKRYKAAAVANPIYGASAAATTAGDKDRKRAGFDFRFKKEKFTLQGDYQMMETGLPGRAANLKGKGYFVEAGYYVRPKFELTLKNDMLKPDDTNVLSKSTVNAGGFNWYFDKKAKFQLVISKIKETVEVKNDRVDSLVTVEF